MNRHAALLVTLLTVAVPPVAAQQNAFVGGLNPVGVGNNNGLQGGNNFGQGNQQGGQANSGFPGGAANADFDSLIDLITSTVGVDSWVDNGGTADIRPFPGGVWIDPAGVLRKVEADPAPRFTSLAVPRLPVKSEAGDVRQSARLRCISLPRLEAEIYHRFRDGRPLDESMLVLAGLRRVKYLFVYPEAGDVVLAGPAGDWRLDAEHRLVSTADGTPVVRLDDLLTLMRREREQQHKPFGCSITPRQENLAATQAFLDASAREPLRPGRQVREAWLEELCNTLGCQDIEVFGLDANTHAAHVLVKADHHMKQIGIGLESGVVGVESYLDAIAKRKSEQPPLNVLRWWFSTNYEGVARNNSDTAFELAGQGVSVLSENELLTQRGERIHTGQADDATQQFAHQFTSEFAALAAKYPIYAELRNLFDLAMIAALLDATDLYATAGWQPIIFLNDQQLPLPQYHAPKEVDTIINHRLIDKTEILAAVSGGVWIDSQGVLAKSERTPIEPSEKLTYHRDRVPEKLSAGTWWWDLD